MSNAFSDSAIFVGRIFHRRFSPKKHQFDYSMYMLALDVDEIEIAEKGQGIFGFSFFHPLRFVEKDYLKEKLKEKLKNTDISEPKSLSQRIKEKVAKLKGFDDIEKITMLVQVRCLGIYFSPANFYFCYDNNNQCTQMLAEVSNTPWNERHYYLVNLLSKDPSCEKTFQVSPFMDLNMSYFWRVIPPSDDNNLLVSIENKTIDETSGVSTRLFDANLVLKKQSFSGKNLLKVWCQLPLMTVKIVWAIYWQALKLLVKRIPFIGYQKTN